MTSAMTRAFAFFLLLGSLKLTCASEDEDEICGEDSETKNVTFFCGAIGTECQILPCNVTHQENVKSLRAVQEKVRSLVIGALLKPEQDGEANAFKFVRKLFRGCTDDRYSKSSSIESIRKIFRELDLHAHNVSKLLQWAIERRLPVILDVQVKPDQSFEKSPVIWVDSPNFLIPFGRLGTETGIKPLMKYIKRVLTIGALEEPPDDQLILKIIAFEQELALTSTSGRRIIRALTFKDVPEMFHVDEAFDLKNLINSISESLDSSGYVDDNSTIIFKNFWYIYALIYNDRPSPSPSSNATDEPIQEENRRALLDIISTDSRLLPLYIKIHYLHAYGFHLHEVWKARNDFMAEIGRMSYPLKELCLNLLESTVPEMVGRIYIDATADQNHTDRENAESIRKRFDDQEFTLYLLLLANDLVQNHSSDFKTAFRDFFISNHSVMYPKITAKAQEAFDEEYDFPETWPDVTIVDLIDQLLMTRSRADFNILYAEEVSDRLEWSGTSPLSLSVGHSDSWPTIYIPIILLRLIEMSNDKSEFWLNLYALLSGARALCLTSIGMLLRLIDNNDSFSEIDRFDPETYIIADRLRDQLDCYKLLYNIETKDITNTSELDLDHICHNFATRIAYYGEKTYVNCDNETGTSNLLLYYERAADVEKAFSPSGSLGHLACTSEIALPRALYNSREFKCAPEDRMHPRHTCSFLEIDPTTSEALCQRNRDKL